ncbi:MAG: hypothetical protein HQK75_16720, partial [Candidatus Magnetomorum sp.]|nr:hypothetical protein [Candidatus Magnetomorum sp.]
MYKKRLILLIATAITCFAVITSYANQLTYTIPDSPGIYDFEMNTWEKASWTEINIDDDIPISKWTILYTWNTDEYFDEGSFHVMSPLGTKFTIASGTSGGTYSVTTESFKDTSSKGKWRLWIEDIYGDGGHQALNITIKIESAVCLVVTIPESAVEGSGNLSGIVAASPAPDTDLLVQLSTSSPDELSLPKTLTIQAGNIQANFEFVVQDDNLLDGTSTQFIMASAPDYSSGKGIIKILDNETAQLNISLPDSAVEGDIVQGTIISEHPVGGNIDVYLSSTDINVLTVPEIVTIPKGLTSVVFEATATVDGLRDKIQTATIHASVNGNDSGSDSINIMDNGVIFIEIPDSPPINHNTRPQNTWDAYQWTEIEIDHQLPILDWKIVFKWNPFGGDSLKQPDTFYARSPSGTLIIISSESPTDTYSISSQAFNNETVNGIWRFWIEDSLYYYTDRATDLTMVITTPVSFLTLQLPESVPENIGSFTGTVIVEPEPENDLVIYLSANPSNLSIQSTTTINAGMNNATFDILVTDNTLLQGPTIHDIVATSPGYYTGTGQINVLDNETAVLTLTVPENITEGTDAGEGMIVFDRAVDGDVNISLISSHPELIKIPETVMLSSGSTSAAFPLTVVFNADTAMESIRITSSVMGWQPASKTITIIPLMIPESERQALVDFYNSTDGENWQYNTNWLGDRGTECSWWGITCNDDATHVIQMEMRRYNMGNFLGGNIKESFVNLQHLAILDLRVNKIYSLPDNFGNLSELTTLIIKNNNLSFLPDSFGNLPKLNNLDLRFNQLNILPESFENLTNLTNLQLEGNNFPVFTFDCLPAVSETDHTVQGILTIASPVSRDIPITFFSSNSDEIIVSNPVTMPAGYTQVITEFTIVDDNLLDGSQQVTLTATFLLSNQAEIISQLDLKKSYEITIHDNEQTIMSLVLPQVIREIDGNEIQGTLSIDRPAERDITIPLVSSNTDMLAFQESIIIPQGLTSVVFTMDITFNKLEDITIRAFVEGWESNVIQTIGIKPFMIPESEYQALIDLFNSTNGYNWVNNENWLGPQGTECSWKGILCDELRQHVVAINLEANNLMGELPDSLINLEQLEHINLSNNYFYHLADSIGAMNLSSLDISENRLKYLPDDICSIQSLTELNVSNNQLVNLPACIGNIQTLSIFNASGNQLTHLPESLFTIEPLTKLYLSDNRLKELPETIGQIQSLSIFDLSNNQLSSFPENLEQLISLAELNLANNHFENLPDSLCYLNLSALDVSGNQLTSMPESIGNLASLSYLNISYNQIQYLPESFGELGLLMALDVSFNQLSSLPDSFGFLEYLMDLNLSYNQLSSLPDSFGSLMNFENLDLSGNQLSSLPENFGYLEYLMDLDLSGNQLTYLPDSIGTFMGLINLDLSDNQLTDLPDSFGDSLYTLMYLDLSNNQLTALPDIFESFSYSLFSLILSKNQLNSLPDSFSMLMALENLDLSYNQFSTLPDIFLNLNSLERLDLSYNQLVALPDSICNTAQLQHLDLSNNQLSHLHDNFGYLTFLIDLNISNNQLTALPDSFALLYGLTHFDASKNKINTLPENFDSFSEIEKIDLSDNNLTYLPDNFSSFASLQDLNLSNNQLSSLPEFFLDSALFIEILNLSNNQLSVLPDNFATNKYSLHKLNLSDNLLTMLPENIGLLTDLKRIYLSRNQLSRLPESFINLSRLSELHATDNQLNSLPENISKLISLSKCYLSSNRLHVLPDDFGYIETLSELDLSDNQLKMLPLSFINLTILEDINLSNNQLITLPVNIGRIENLKSIDVSNNKLTILPDSIGGLQKLSEIYLSENQLQQLPASFYDLINLETLDLSENQLTDLSEDIINLHKLRILRLSNNNLGAQIIDIYDYDINDEEYEFDDKKLPDNLFNLTGLRELMVDGNNLEEIPEKIDNLFQLKYLSLANNPLYQIDSLKNQEGLERLQKMPIYLKSIANLSALSSLSLANSFFFSEDHIKDFNIDHSLFEIPAEFVKLKNLHLFDISGTILYTSSPELETIIQEKTIGWTNTIPVTIPASEALKIKYITSTSTSLTYSLHSTIALEIVMTQPVRLVNGDLVLTLDIGSRKENIIIHPFEYSDTINVNYTVKEGDYINDMNVFSIGFSGPATLRNKNGDDADLSLPDKFNLAQMKNVYVDGTIPTVSITNPTDQCILELGRIQGTASDISSDYSLILTISDLEGAILWNQTKACNEPFVAWEFSLPYDFWLINATYMIKVNVRDFAGNSNETIQTVTYGQKSSAITSNLSVNTIRLGQKLKIFGFISPAENITGKEVTVNLESPAGDVSGRIVNANEDGSFEYELQCDDINHAGQWTVSSKWEGTSCLEKATSESVIFTVNPSQPLIVLDTTSSAIKLGEGVSITGKVKPEFYCESLMTNIPVTIRVNGPSDTHEITTTTNDKFGAFIVKNHMGIDEIGSWMIQAEVEEDAYKEHFPAYKPAFSTTCKIEVVESAGYAIIVQGKIASEEGLESHNKTANSVYHHLKQRGLLDKDILYFNYDTSQASYKITDKVLAALSEDNVPPNLIDQLKKIKDIAFPGENDFLNQLESLDNQMIQYQSQILDHSSQPIEIDGLPTKNAIRKAIVEDMPEIMASQPANLYIVMVDHGTEDTFYIEPDTISDHELNDWLTELENSPGWNQEIVVMLGFCFSGSFIDELSKPNRIIIASAGPNEFSYKGPLDQDNIREGEYFLAEFFKSVAMGKNVKESFAEAVIQTEIFTDKGDQGSVNAPPYFDNSAQHPLLDDNGDKKGTNNVIETSEDGELAEDITIGVSPMSMNDLGDVVLTEISDIIFLGSDETTTDQIWAKVSDGQRLLSLWIEVKSPDFVPNAVGSGQVEMDLPKIIYSRNDNLTDRYYWDSEDLGNIFDVPGTYHIYFFAKDTDSKNVAPMKETIVYKASSVNKPPDPFELLYPGNGIEVTTLGVLASLSADPTAEAYTMISWEETTDPDNDHLSY